MTVRLMALMSAAISIAACSTNRDVSHSWCPPVHEKEMIPEPVKEVPQPVVEPKPVVELKPVVEKEINISADALFSFNKSSINDMHPEGKKKLDEFANHLTGYYDNATVTVIGHTDRLGSEEYNQILGQKRADTVKAYLMSKGVTNINALSMGKKQPVTTNCLDKKVSAALKQCLQPDRRVVIRFSGTQK